MRKPIGISPFFLLLLLSLAFLTNCENREMTAHLKQADSLLAHDNAQQAYDLLLPDSAFYAHTSPSFRNRYMLTFFNAKDQAFVPLCDDSMMLEVEKYYTGMKQNNEATLARYLVAACYRDMDLPTMAQQWATKAIELADTTRANFDFTLLYKAEMLLGNAYENAISSTLTMNAYQQAAFHALKANDSIRWCTALQNVASTLLAKGILNESIALSNENMRYYRTHHTDDYCIFGTYLDLARAYCKKKEYHMANEYLEMARHVSQNTEKNIKEVHLYTAYYANKINVLIGLNQLDSALIFAYTEMSAPENCFKSGALFKLSKIHFLMGNKDSAYTYMERYTEFIDSIQEMALDQNLQKYQNHLDIMQSRNQINEYRNSSHNKKLFFTISLIALTTVIIVLSILDLQKERTLKGKLQAKTKELQNLQETLETIKTDNEKKLVTERLKTQIIATKHQIQDIGDAAYKSLLFESRIKLIAQSEKITEIKNVILKDQVISTTACSEIIQEIKIICPSIYEVLNNPLYMQQSGSLQLCVLLILQMRNKEITRILGWSSQLISTNKARLNETIFHEKGAKDFVINLTTA